MRPKTTGRFNTRAELVERIRFLYFETDCSQAAIARNTRVSAMTVGKIIDAKEWEHLQDSDYIENGMIMKTTSTDRRLTREEQAEVDRMSKNEKHARSATCGHGYTLPSYPVHLDSRILNELELQPIRREAEEWWANL